MKQSRLTLLELIKKQQWEFGLAATLIVAGFFRLWELSSLAPGLGQDEAQIAMRALAFSQHPGLDLFTEAHSLGSSVFISLQAIFVQIFGSTPFGIRVFPALLGVLSVWFVFLWLDNWFNRRIGLIGALLYAVTPWVVTASRLGDESGIILTIIPLTLWLLTRALQTNSSWRYMLAGVVLGLGLTNELGGYVLAASALLMAAYLSVRRREFIKFSAKGLGMGLLGLLMVVSLTALTHFGSPDRMSEALLPVLSMSEQSLSHRLTGITKTLLMFNFRGDNTFTYNIGGAPLLNFFVGLMFVMGLLVALSRVHRARYGALLALIVLFLVPAFLSPTPPDARAALTAAPIVIALAAIGISYLMDIWYGTFPVNSAARTFGTLPIILLLLVTAYQGYKQYFVAWAGSPEVYQAYNESAISIAGWLNRTTFEGQRYVAVDSYSRNVLDYLTHGKAVYNAINVSDVAKIPADDEPKQIVVVSSALGDTLKVLKERFPKAKLSQHYSEHNDNNELFNVFEVLKQ